MLKVANSVINASRITGVLPVVNGGTGVTTSTGTGSVVLSAAPTLSGDVALSTGNLVIGTAGKGIDFSATPGTGTSELLADYEEGTWTPNIGGTATYTTQIGTYTKIGRTVQVNGILHIDTIGTGIGYLVSGLPFSAANNSIGSSVSLSIWQNLATIPVYASGYIEPNTSNIALYATLTGAATLSITSILGSNSKIYFSGTYIV